MNEENIKSIADKQKISNEEAVTLLEFMMQLTLVEARKVKHFVLALRGAN